MKLSERLSAWANHVANDEYEICIEAADLLEECERAFEFIAQDDCGCDECNKAREMLTKLRTQAQHK